MVIYLAHPVGQEPQRAENLERAVAWFAWLLVHFPRHAIVAPWWLYCRVLPETPEHRERGIRDDLEVLGRCDAIALVGGRMSPGMASELELAIKGGLEVLNLLHLGEKPPP